MYWSPDLNDRIPKRLRLHSVIVAAALTVVISSPSVAHAQNVPQAITIHSVDQVERILGPGHDAFIAPKWNTYSKEYLEGLKWGDPVRFEIRDLGQGQILLPKNRPDISLPVFDGSIPDFWKDLPLQAEARMLTDGTFELQDPTLEILAGWNADQDLFPNHQYRELHERYQVLESVSENWIPQLSESIAEDTAKLELATESVFEAALAEYSEISDSFPLGYPLRRALVRQVAHATELRTSIRERKAVYGLDDRYSPSTYLTIYEASRSAVGLLKNEGSQPYCSGVLVGNDVVLTALHCLHHENDLMAPEDIEVIFDYVGNGGQSQIFPVLEVYPSPRPGGDQEQLDFGLLILDLAAADADLLEDGASPLPKPLCLSRSHVKRETPVYAVGHPRQAFKMIADNSRVHFPFQVEQNAFANLQALLESEFEDLTILAQKLDELTKSYRPVKDEQGQPTGSFRYFRNETWGSQPVFGVDTDTFGGNSGSPVFNRRSRTHKVLGILISGMRDRPRAFNPGWDAHESILPASEILRNLDEALPNWRQRGFCT